MCVKLYITSLARVVSIVLFSVCAHSRQRPEIWRCPCACAQCQRSL